MLVFGLTATPFGPSPTGIVVVTLHVWTGAWDAPAGDADDAVRAAAGISPVISTVARVIAPRMSLMKSCSLPPAALLAGIHILMGQARFLSVRPADRRCQPKEQEEYLTVRPQSAP